MARPRTIDVNDLIEKLNAYIDETEEPMITEFCLKYGISKSRLYELKAEYQELTDSIKKAISKEEQFLVQNAERNKINPIFAIFRLKQPCFGWKDKQEIETTGEVINFNLDKFSSDDLEKILKNKE